MMDLPTSDRYNLLSLRLAKFAGAGAVGMVADMGTLFVAVSVGGVDPLIGKIGAVLVAILVAFLLNERYTYHASDTSLKAICYRYLKSNLVRTGGVVVALSTLYILHTHLGIFYLVANLVGIGVGFVVNYLAESFYTWQIHQ